ncbi:MAG: PIN domain-containing protein [Anaerolineales bacterium]|jgi:predicted nucleic acid-binding protein
MPDKQDRQFVDTNILVYAHDRSAGEKHDKAKTLLGKLWESGNGCLSVQVLQEFYVTVTQKVPAPLGSDSAAKIIESLSYWLAHAPGPQDVLTAIDIQQRHQISFWDAMIVQSAAQLDCNILWSEDFNHGQVYADVKSLNPFVKGF